MKYLWQALLVYKKESLLAPFLKMIEAILNLLVPYILAKIINHGILNHDFNYVLFFLVILAFLAIISFLFSFVAQYAAAKAACGITKEIRQKLFNHCQDFSYQQIDKITENTIITRLINDTSTLQNGLNLSLRLLLRSPFIVIGSIIMIYLINPLEAIIFIIIIIILSSIFFLISFFNLSFLSKAQIQLEKLLLATHEMLSGIRIIRSFNKEKYFQKRFDQQNKILYQLSKKVAYISTLFNPLTYFLINTATIILIYIGALKISNGQLQQGDLIAIYHYSMQMIIELIKLSSLIITIHRSIISFKRISEILDVPIWQKRNTYINKKEVKGPIKFQNVSFKYSTNSSLTLENISFIAKENTTIGIIGKIGSGKSSLINLIPQLYIHQYGTITINHQPIQQYDKEELIKHIGIVSQKSVLFKGTIRENLLYANPNASDKEIWSALDAAIAKEMVQQKPKQLDFMLTKGGKNLSGGQRQRLCIARSLLKKPRILILDDASSALDSQTESALKKSLQSLKNVTIFLISQRLSFLKHADNILVLDKGKIIKQGNHDYLMKNCELYYHLYCSQYDLSEREKEI